MNFVKKVTGAAVVDWEKLAAYTLSRDVGQYLERPYPTKDTPLFDNSVAAAQENLAMLMLLQATGQVSALEQPLESSKQALLGVYSELSKVVSKKYKAEDLVEEFMLKIRAYINVEYDKAKQPAAAMS